MRASIVFALVLSVVAVLQVNAGEHHDFDAEEMIDLLFMYTAKDCQSKRGDPPKSHECLIACGFESLGLIKDKKISYEGLQKSVALFPDNDRLAEVTQRIYTSCSAITHDDVCEAAMEILLCSGVVIKEMLHEVKE